MVSALDFKQKGIWIAFEGIDGSGKTTQIKLLADYLKNQGFEVVETKEPGGNPFSDKIRELIFDPEVSEDPISQLYLFAVSRRRNIKDVVLPGLKAGKIVLSDRSEGSTYAYQHFQFGVPLETITKINDLATEGVKPDITILLDAKVDVGLERIKISQKKDINYFDQSEGEKWEERRVGYLDLAKKFLNWIVIDGDKKEEKVLADIIEALKDRKIFS